MDSISALKAALAIAQADRQVTDDEVEVLSRLCELEGLDGWDSIALREGAAKPVDLDAALRGIEDEPDRHYVLTLCHVMALAGGISAPESALLARIGQRWAFTGLMLDQVRREAETLYTRLTG